MPFSAPYNPPLYPQIQTSKASLFTSIGAGQVGGSNYFKFGIAQSFPTNMVSTIHNPLNLSDTGVLIGSVGYYGNTFIPRSFYDNGYGLQFVATVYAQYDATYGDWSPQFIWTGMPGGIVQYGQQTIVNGGAAGTLVKLYFDSGILVPGSDYGITDINSSGTIGTNLSCNWQGEVGTDPLVAVENSPGLEVFAWSF